MLRQGEIGTLQEVRARGKEDRRAGGEDIAVDGCHQMVLLRMLLGEPKWVFAHVTHDGREIGREHIKEASEPIGPIAGNQIASIFAFDGGVHAYFGSKANDLTDPKRFGYYFYGSAGVIYMPNGVEPQPYILRSPAWMPDERRRWEKIETPRDPVRGFKAEGRELANPRMVGDLLEAIEHGRDPVCNARDGRWSTEMIVSIYESQRTAGRVSFPSKERRHPFPAVSHRLELLGPLGPARGVLFMNRRQFASFSSATAAALAGSVKTIPTFAATPRRALMKPGTDGAISDKT